MSRSGAGRTDLEGKASMPPSPALPAVTRRVILGIAFAVGLVVASWQQPALVRAADSPAADNASAGTAAVVPAPGKAPAEAAANASPAAPDGGGKTGADKADATISISPHGVDVVTRSENGTTSDKHIDVRRGRVEVQGFGNDRVYDSFEQFMREAPGTALFAFLIVTVVFLVPLLAIALLVWYKIRRTRMQHEAMLKLAERGVVSPAAAMEALAGGASPAATMDSLARVAATSGAAPGAAAPSGNAPLYEQARQLRRRTAWSDLRKGVILIAVGIGLSAYSMFDDGTPNGAGLVLLFLGIGYCVLWYFQDRPVDPTQPPPAPPGGA
ncbi:MAG TPA: hypothetical protein VF925_09595 [Casimicrobiaceae bacterium]